jgi:FMN phosphatase YigB (HAD superfamily)
MKYLAVDIGNVLCHVNFDKFLCQLSEALNITLEDAKYFLNRSQKLHDLGLTVMADELRDHFKIKSPVVIDKLLHTWDGSLVPDLDVLNMCNHLTEHHDLKVALLSNIGIEHTSLMEQILEHNGFFHNAIKHFSCQVGARKPSLLFYQSFLMEHPEFQGCLYIDDIVDNLEAGKKFGFRCYHFALDSMDIQAELPEVEKAILDENG